MPACRRLLFPLLHAEKEMGDVCTQAKSCNDDAKKFTEIHVMHVQKCLTDLNLLLFCRAPCHRHRRHWLRQATEMCYELVLQHCCKTSQKRTLPQKGGGGVLPYIGYIGMCRGEGYGFQAVYSRIGYVNQSVWV